MKIFLILISMVLGAKAFAKHDCDIHLKKVDICANILFKVAPNKKKSSDFEISFIDKKTLKNIMPKQNVETYLWMNMKDSEGHGSDAIILEKKDKKYVAKNVWFLMEGDWELHITLKENNNIIDSGHKPVCISGRRINCKK